MTPRVIYLNGASSAGKTTLAKHLQESFDEPFLITGIDLLIRHMIPKKLFHSFSSEDQYFSGFYWIEKKDSEGKPLLHLFMGHRAMIAWEGLVQLTLGLLQTGNSVIIDDVAFRGKWQVERWKEALTPISHQHSS